MLLKQPEDSNLNLPVWDPRVSMKKGLFLDFFKCQSPDMSLILLGKELLLLLKAMNSLYMHYILLGTAEKTPQPLNIP